MGPELGVLITLGGLLLTAGAAWGGARTALNGTRRRVEELHTQFIEHTKADLEHQREALDRLARIETKLETRR